MNFNVFCGSSCSGKMAKVFFKVLQGSVATHVRCGGKHDEGFTANFLLNSRVEEF